MGSYYYTAGPQQRQAVKTIANQKEVSLELVNRKKSYFNRFFEIMLEFVTFLSKFLYMISYILIEM